MSAPGDKQKAEVSRVNWQTPPELFKWLNDRHHFTIDGAADSWNHLLPCYYSEECSAFDQSPEGQSIFNNPPYGNLSPWIDLFIRWKRLNDVVALVPCAPDTEWWNDARETAHQTIIMGPGRVKFIDPTTGLPGASNTTASSLFFWNPTRLYLPMAVWDWRKDVFG